MSEYFILVERHKGRRLATVKKIAKANGFWFVETTPERWSFATDNDGSASRREREFYEDLTKAGL